MCELLAKKNKHGLFLWRRKAQQTHARLQARIGALTCCRRGCTHSFHRRQAAREPPRGETCCGMCRAHHPAETAGTCLSVLVLS